MSTTTLNGESEQAARLLQLRQRISENIKEYGQFILGVGATSEEDANDRTNYFMYTIGNVEQNLPELIVIGFMSPELAPLINSVGKRLREAGAPFKHGEIFVPDGFTYPVKIIDADPRALDMIVQAYEHYPHIDRSQFQLQQIVLCDVDENFPGDVNCNPTIALQPFSY